MKILLLTNRVPYPLHDGGNLAVNALINGMTAQQVSLDVVAMNTTRHYVSKEIIQSEFANIHLFKAVDVNNKIRIWDAFINLFSTQSYHITRFWSEDYWNAIQRLLLQNKYDIIQLEGLFVTPYFDKIAAMTDTPIVYRQHNIEYEIWEQLAATTKNKLKHWYLNILAKRLKKYEIEWLNKIKYIIPISTIDVEKSLQYNQKLQVHHAGFGVAADSIRKEPFIYNNKVYHVGAMDWMPNKEGIEWMLSNVWPTVVRQHDTAQFYFGGRNLTCTEFYPLPTRATCCGEINDMNAFIKDKQVLVVPIIATSGIRIKIIQAMCQGKTIIATAEAVKGLAVVHEQHLLIARDENELQKYILQVLEDEALSYRLAQNAYEYAQNNFNNTTIIKQLLAFYSSIKL